MKRFICILALCAFAAVCAPRPAQAAVDVGTSASFAVAIDAQTGRILYDKNAHGRHSMASTTKIMTAIVALEHGNLDDEVTVSPAAAATEGSSMYLSPGEKITLGNLLYGLMLPSGNDAAMAIGEHVGGDIPGFAAMMNETAQKIGAVNTQFQNPSGLDAEGHYSTAYDMAIITRYAMKNPAFAEIVQTKKKKVPWEGKQWDRTLENHNKLLSMYEGCIGVKTGYTKKTGRCLVSAAQRGGMTVICVTLADPNDWADHAAIYDAIFSEYEAKTLLQSGQKAADVAVLEGAAQTVEAVYADNFTYFAAEGEGDLLTVEQAVSPQVSAPVTKGQILGKATVSFNGEVLGEVNLAAGQDVAQVIVKTFPKSLKKLFGVLLHLMLKV